MSIFGGSERFPNEAARSPGPIYAKPDVRAKGQVVMKADYKPVDENRKWGKRESWIGGSPSPHMPIKRRGTVTQVLNAVRSSAAASLSIRRQQSGAWPLQRQLQDHQDAGAADVLPQVRPLLIAERCGFPLIELLSVGQLTLYAPAFAFAAVNMTGMGHQRELMAAESPGPKYNVNYLACNGGKAAPPKFSFAPPASPRSAARAEAHKMRLPDVDSPRRGHRESWLSVINRNGVLVMPASPVRPRPPPSGGPATQEHSGVSASGGSEEQPPSSSNNNASGKNGGNAFGHEQRFGKRQSEPAEPQTPGRQAAGNTRVQFVSSQHTRENMGEFSPGPIYAPYNPDCPGGRLAPSPKSARRPPPPNSPQDAKDPHANLSSRSSWLAGAVRKCDGQETVLMRMGDVPPGPGSYAEPRSSFATFSHNAKTKAAPHMVQSFAAGRAAASD
ncbi:hypothetical protein BBJ28_00014826 [Nothophytophthora sp. Chile5]|nr:hypothetical protein BBJ28_00014826 [Nothophytophthora sp. Chile5]